METILSSKPANGLGPVSFGDRKLDSRDMANPASREIVDKLSVLRDKVLNSNNPILQAGLKKYVGRDLIIKHSADSQEVEVSVKGRLNTAPILILKSTNLFDTADVSSLKAATQLANDLNIGDVSPNLVGQLKDKQAHPALIWLISAMNQLGNKYLVKVLLELVNINAFSADFLSMARNSTNAATRGTAGSLTMLTKIGGAMAVVTGAYFALKALLDVFIALALGDAKGAAMNVVFFVAFLGYMGMGLVMLGVIQGFDASIGLIFYCFNGLCTGYQLIADSIFRRELNQRFKTGSTEDLVKTLEWMKDEIEKHPKDFARSTSAGAARRVANEVNEEGLLKKLRGNDPEAVAQAIHLIEEVSKANFVNIYAGICMMIITALGVAANVLTGGNSELAIPIFYAIGAFLWIIACDLKFERLLDFNMKEWVGDQFWSLHQKRAFWETINAIKQKACDSPQLKLQSTTFSPTFAPKEALEKTA